MSMLGPIALRGTVTVTARGMVKARVTDKARVTVRVTIIVRIWAHRIHVAHSTQVSASKQNFAASSRVRIDQQSSKNIPAVCSDHGGQGYRDSLGTACQQPQRRVSSGAVTTSSLT